MSSPYVEAQYGEVRHHIVGASAVNPRRIYRQSFALEGLQFHCQRRRRDQRIAAVLRVAPGVGGAERLAESARNGTTVTDDDFPTDMAAGENKGY